MDTKTQILDAAEALFAEQGFDATSLRAVTACAGVNLAAVNYHFGSKDGLLQAVFERRIGPVNEERIARLEAATTSAVDGTVPLGELLEIFLVPALRLGEQEKGRAFLQIIGRLHGEMDRDHVRGLMRSQFTELKQRFLPAFRAAVPELPEDVLMARIHFLIGAMAHTMLCGNELEFLSDGRVGVPSPSAQVAGLTAFAEAGFRAPVPASDEPERSKCGDGGRRS